MTNKLAAALSYFKPCCSYQDVLIDYVSRLHTIRVYCHGRVTLSDYRNLWVLKFKNSRWLAVSVGSISAKL